ncbi:MAG: ribonuclease protein component [Actinomycetota bacterium]
MLSRAQRIVTGEEYRSVVRRGRRSVSEDVVVYRLDDPADRHPPRFGFIVSKAVGNAVVRNRVRRRLKAVAFEVAPGLSAGSVVVIRALPVAAQASWVTLRAEIASAVTTSRVAKTMTDVNEGMARV